MTIKVVAAAFFVAASLAGGAAVAAEPTQLDPAALAYKLPAQIDWRGDPAEGVQSAVLVGDPSKPGLYVMLVKWLPHHMSRPHWHPNDRYVVVMSGVWWVATGWTYDPDHTTPIPAGSFVTHFAKQIHYDGAKDEPAVLEIVGEGPATAIPAQ